MARSRNESLLALEKEKEYTQLEKDKDKAKADLEKAKAALIEHERVLDSALRDRNSLKI